MLLRWLIVFCFFTTSQLNAGELTSFPVAKAGKGELRYLDGVPVLTLCGTPAEMGEQFGILAIRNAPDLPGLQKRFLQDSGQEDKYPFIVKMAKRLSANFPAHHLSELKASAIAADRDEDRLLFANTVADLSSGMGCSTIVVGKERSKLGEPLFGRNFDWLPVPGITEHTLVAIYKGIGKRAFASVVVTPISGVVSGINDAGLALTINEISIRKTKDKATFNWDGVPLLLEFRRVLEECSTVSEAEKLLLSMPRTTTCALTLCDKNGGAVFEITPKSLVVRSPNQGVCCCTNHFRSELLSVENRCWRYDKLAPLFEKQDIKLNVKDVFGQLDEVHQGKATLQSMVFEPAKLTLHLAYGTGPATRLEPHKLELAALFESK